MLRVFFPPGVRGEGDIELVPAVRGGSGAYRHSAWNARYRELFDQAQQHFVATDLDHAQVVFYPQMYAPRAETHAAIDAARGRGLPLIFLKTGDWTAPIRVPYGVVYRHSILASKRQACEAAMPAFCEDSLQATPGALPIRRWCARPRVGFCGYVGRRASRIAYRLLGRRRKALGLELRARVLRELATTKALDCRFVCNDRFMGGKAGVLNANLERARRIRADYVQNILDSDYTVCVRGAGNFSYRFYEVLSAGRIPIYVNTDTVLPYEGEIDWKRHCVWVEADELDLIGEKVVDFHRTLDDTSFSKLQQRNRELWEEYLRPLAFYRRALAKAIAD